MAKRDGMKVHGPADEKIRALYARLDAMRDERPGPVTSRYRLKDLRGPDRDAEIANLRRKK